MLVFIDPPSPSVDHVCVWIGFRECSGGPGLSDLGIQGEVLQKKKAWKRHVHFCLYICLCVHFVLYMGFRVQLFLGIGVHVADKVLHGPCSTTGATWILRGLGCLGECLSGGLSGGLSAGLSGGQYGSAIAYASWTGLCFGQL